MAAADLSIRRGTAQDADAISAMMHRLVEFGPPAWRDPPRMVLIDQERIRRSLASGHQDPVVLVATRGERIAGFVHLHGLVDQYHTEPHGHLEDIVVARDFEGQGVARLLLDAAERWAKQQGFEWLSLSVFEGNARAREMYERAGFGRDIVRMVKTLT